MTQIGSPKRVIRIPVPASEPREEPTVAPAPPAREPEKVPA